MLPRTATEMYCQRCGTAWAQSDSDARHYFASETTFAVGDLVSPAQIALLNPTEEITYCPACEDGQIASGYKRTEPAGIRESPFYRGDSRMIGEEEADVKARQAELDSAKHAADVTHDTR